MNLLKKIWNEIRKGENLDLYITASTAICLVILNLLGKVSSDHLAQLTIAVLALLAINILVNRHRLEKTIQTINENTKGIKVHKNQSKANEQLLAYLKKQHIKEAKFIEYDSDSIKPVILALLESGTNVHLLIQHPETAISSYQKTKILHQIKTKERDYALFGNLLKVDYYKDIASIRGRCFSDHLICIGWYTYDRRVKKNEQEVWGHINPAIIAEPFNSDYITLQSMFDEVFNNLLRNSDTFETVKEKYK